MNPLIQAVITACVLYKNKIKCKKIKKRNIQESEKSEENGLNSSLDPGADFLSSSDISAYLKLDEGRKLMTLESHSVSLLFHLLLFSLY